MVNKEIQRKLIMWQNQMRLMEFKLRNRKMPVLLKENIAEKIEQIGWNLNDLEGFLDDN